MRVRKRNRLVLLTAVGLTRGGLAFSGGNTGIAYADTNGPETITTNDAQKTFVTASSGKLYAQYEGQWKEGYGYHRVNIIKQPRSGNTRREDYIFCTWESLDLVELQRNLRYYGLNRMAEGPFRFLDVQKLFSIAYEDSKVRRSLEYAVNYLNIKKDIPFHRAFSDAYYTAKILAHLKGAVLENYSIDTYILPANRQEEIHVMFHDYMKYISREFPDKQSALEDREVISTKCYICHKNIRRKIRWFSPNGKHYYSISHCPVHGHMKSKIRIRKSENNLVYVVKTSKFISEDDCQKVIQKREAAKEHHKIKKIRHQD